MILFELFYSVKYAHKFKTYFIFIYFRLPAIIYSLALLRSEGCRLLIVVRYLTAKMFGTNVIMFCSPHPYGIRMRFVTPAIEGPIRSPEKT